MTDGRWPKYNNRNIAIKDTLRNWRVSFYKERSVYESVIGQRPSAIITFPLFCKQPNLYLVSQYRSMSTIFIVLIILVTLLLLARLQSAAVKRKRIAALGRQWGKQKEEHFPFHLISQYKAASREKSFHEISQQTMMDIDFDELFMTIDRTVSKPGQQFLYHQLKNPSGDKRSLLAFDERVDFFLQHDGTRVKAQQSLLLLSDAEGYSITKLLDDELLPRPSWFNWLYLDLAIVITLLVLSPFYPVCLILLVFPLAINLFLHFLEREQYIWLHPFIAAVEQNDPGNGGA